MLYDIMIFEGEVLLLLLGLVNCDDWVFDDLDDYCIGCEIGCKLVSFGSGVYFCLGFIWFGWKFGWFWVCCCVGFVIMKLMMIMLCVFILVMCVDLFIC